MERLRQFWSEATGPEWGMWGDLPLPQTPLGIARAARCRYSPRDSTGWSSDGDAAASGASARTELGRAGERRGGGLGARAPKDYANTRFSALDQITRDNVNDLKLAWSFSTGVNRGQEAAPIVAEQTMFVVTAYPNILYALDLTRGGALKGSAQTRSGAGPALRAAPR